MWELLFVFFFYERRINYAVDNNNTGSLRKGKCNVLAVAYIEQRDAYPMTVARVLLSVNHIDIHLNVDKSRAIQSAMNQRLVTLRLQFATCLDILGNNIEKFFSYLGRDLNKMHRMFTECY